MFTKMENEMIESKDVKSQTTDLISELPRGLLETILERLPLQDAVKTSILSKKWRYNWTTITQLHFGYDFIQFITSNGSLKEFGFENIINSIFRHYSGHALSFTPCLPKLFCEASLEFDKWMLLLSEKGVKVLSLNPNFDPDGSPLENHPMKMSSHLFSCKDLRVLRLCNFVLELQPPPASICFKNLIAIYFEGVEIANDVFEAIISSALQLQSLKVSYCKGVDHLNVDAPKLREIYVSGNFTTINLNSMPDLKNATFGFKKLDISSCHGLSIDRWPQLKKLYLVSDSFQVFAAGIATKLLPTNFYHLKSLTLSDIDFEAPGQFYDVVCLIKSSRNLQKLEISYPTYEEWVIEPITKWMEVQEWTDCSLDQLRKVKMEMISCVSPELLLLKGLLRISPVLEIMSVQPSIYPVENEAVMFKAALEQFPRASPRARVIQHDSTLHL